MGADFWTVLGFIIVSLFAQYLNHLRLLKIGKVADATHALTNSAYLSLQTRFAILMRKEADRSGDEEDLQLAEEAERQVMEHQKKQKELDENKNKNTQ